MMDLYIEHNPFTVETKILLDNIEPENNSFLSKFSHQRLQIWIDNLFKELHDNCGGELSYNITFKGTDTDSLDVEEAVIKAREDGFKIQLKYITVEGGEARLGKITQLIKEAENNPLFSDYFNESRDVQRNLETALDKDFDAYVVATMSSGKSTFINSMLGCDLLPALNEATTATIAKIYNDKSKEQGEFEVSRIAKDGSIKDKDHSIHIKDLESKKEAEILSVWNKDELTYSIEISGNVIGIDKNDNVRLVITDTPGPNNSQDEEHSKTTLRYIKDSDRSPMILYVLNATQLGINDDRSLLKEISDSMKKGGKQSRDRFLFILNKADSLDEEKGETVASIVANAKNYLQKNGIDNPRIYPVSSLCSSLFRKRSLSTSLLTKKERDTLAALESQFLEDEEYPDEGYMDLVQGMPLNQSERKLLAEKNYPLVLQRSGVPAVEVVISEYINKYNLPHRVSRAYEVLKEVIVRSSNKSEIEKSLDVNESELQEIIKAVEALTDQQNSAFKTQGFIDSLGKEAALSDNITQLMLQRQRETTTGINDCGDHMKDVNVDPDVAERELSFLQSSVQMRIDSMLIDLEKINEEAQSEVRQHLIESYQLYIANIFDNVTNFSGDQLPIFNSMRKQLEGFADKAFVLNSGDIDNVNRYVTRTRTVKASKWWNPFSWGSTKEESYTDTITERKVNLQKLWKSRYIEITKYVNQTTKDATIESERQAKHTLNVFSAFISKEFDKGFEQLTSSLKAQLSDKKEREVAIKQAKEDLEAIKVFEDKLVSILSL